MVLNLRWKLASVGLFLLLMWLACSAMTVVPEARHEQWFASNALAFLAGGAFGAALLTRQAKQ